VRQRRFRFAFASATVAVVSACAPPSPLLVVVGSPKQANRLFTVIDFVNSSAPAETLVTSQAGGTIVACNGRALVAVGVTKELSCSREGATEPLF
jgi:hypothetical protein